MYIGFRTHRRPNTNGETKMTNLVFRVLDLTISFAVLGLTLTIAGATAVLGA